MRTRKVLSKNEIADLLDGHAAARSEAAPAAAKTQPFNWTLASAGGVYRVNHAAFLELIRSCDELIRIFVRDFREAAPYINYLRGKTLVIGIAGSLLEGATLRTLAADLNLLASLGVPAGGGARLAQPNQCPCRARGQARRIYQQRPPHHRLKPRLTLRQEACGMLRCDIEAALSIGMTTASHQRSRALAIAAGNFVSARPLGVIDGIAGLHRPRARKIDTESSASASTAARRVLISPWAFIERQNLQPEHGRYRRSCPRHRAGCRS